MNTKTIVAFFYICMLSTTTLLPQPKNIPSLLLLKLLGPSSHNIHNVRYIKFSENEENKTKKTTEEIIKNNKEKIIKGEFTRSIKHKKIDNIGIEKIVKITFK